MRILWATPYNIKSAIGTFSREVCRELEQRGHKVTILRIESGAEAITPAITSDFKVLRPDDPVPKDIDLIVINYGNHAPYHAGSLSLAANNPAVAIFHDAEMRNFAWGMVDRHNFVLPSLFLFESASHHDKEFDMVDPDSRPILQLLSCMASSAVVHSPHYWPTVAEKCPGMVEVIPLCFPDISASDPSTRKAGPLRVTMFGVISNHKQPERLLKAIATLQEDFGTIEVHLAGAIEDWYRLHLNEFAKQAGLLEPTFYGYLSDITLSTVLIESDVTCCLRFPVTEGGSASLITALYHGRPLIVSDVASYSVVPDCCLAKVSYGEDVSDLADALRHILDNPIEANSRALEARAWARRSYSAQAYADKLEPLMAKALGITPALIACRQLSVKACYPDGQVMLPAFIDIANACEDLLF